jgi:hypothetical protein
MRTLATLSDDRPGIMTAMIDNASCSSYVPAPTTFLHTLDARVKQLWLVALYFLVARATPEVGCVRTRGHLRKTEGLLC